MITALIGWMVLGLIAGAIGRLLVPGRQPIGLLMTMLLGVAGSYVGGFVAYLFTGGDWLQPSGWILKLGSRVVTCPLHLLGEEGDASLSGPHVRVSHRLTPALFLNHSPFLQQFSLPGVPGCS